MWAQYPDAGMTRRRVGTYVGEIEIKGGKDPILRLGGVKDSWIGVTSQLLVDYGMHVVTRLAKQVFSVTR